MAESVGALHLALVKTESVLHRPSRLKINLEGQYSRAKPGLLQTRRPNKSKEDLLGHYSWLYRINKEFQAFLPQLGSAQPFPASA
jgi:hypothetical protein